MKITKLSKGWLAFSSVLLLVGFALAGCNTAANSTPTTPGNVVQQSGKTISEGHVYPKDDFNLFFLSPGKVSDILVKEGDQVAKGAVLAKLGDQESFAAAVASAQLELTNAQQQMDDLNDHANLVFRQTNDDLAAAQQQYIADKQTLDKLDTADYETKIDNARATAATAESDLKDATDEFNKYKNLEKDNSDRVRTKSALDAAQDKYNTAKHDLDVLVNDLDLAKAKMEADLARVQDLQSKADVRANGPDPKDLALAQARLDNARAQLSAAQAALAHQDLTAPFAGKIVKVDMSVGEEVQPDQVVMILADYSVMYVDTSDLVENDVVKVKVGQKVTVTADALPAVNMKGTVESINDRFVEKAGDITYVVHILLKDPDPRLRWGMTVKVSFDENP